MSRALDRANLSATILQSLQRIGIKCADDFYDTSLISITAQTNLNYDDVKEASRIISSKYSPRSETILSIKHRQASNNSPYLSTGSQELDLLLKGGYTYGHITEIVGLPGLGKTQLCFTCCVDAVINGLSVLYFDTELKFDPLRLSQLVKYKFSNESTSIYHHSSKSSSSSSSMTNTELDNILERIQMRRPLSSKELLDDIQGLEDTIITNKISVVVIDSITALIRKDHIIGIDRDNYLLHIISTLTRLADLCHCVILITNQITAASSHEALTNPYHDIIPDITGQIYKPALGIVWHQLVHTRLVLCRQSRNHDSNVNMTSNTMIYKQNSVINNMEIQQDEEVNEDKLYAAMQQATTSILMSDIDRILVINKSPYLPQISVKYTIESYGLIIHTSAGL